MAIVLSGFFVFICLVLHLLANLNISSFILVRHHCLLFTISLYVFPAWRWALCNVCALWMISFLYSSFWISLQSNIWSVEIFYFGHAQMQYLFLVQYYFIVYRIFSSFSSNADFSFHHIFCIGDFLNKCKSPVLFFQSWAFWKNV